MIHSQDISTLGRKKKKAPAAPEVSSKSFLHSRPELEDIAVGQCLLPQLGGAGGNLSRPRTGRHGKTRAPLPPRQIKMKPALPAINKDVTGGGGGEGGGITFKFESEPRSSSRTRTRPLSGSVTPASSSCLQPQPPPPPPEAPAPPPPPPPPSLSLVRVARPVVRRTPALVTSPSDPRADLLQAIRDCGGVKGLRPVNSQA